MFELSMFCFEGDPFQRFVRFAESGCCIPPGIFSLVHSVLPLVFLEPAVSHHMVSDLCVWTTNVSKMTMWNTCMTVGPEIVFSDQCSG